MTSLSDFIDYKLQFAVTKQKQLFDMGIAVMSISVPFV